MENSDRLMFRQVVRAVDDDADMLALLDATLKRNGYIVLKAANGALALHLIQSFMPNLLLIDALMPDMNGFELCERVRQIPHTTNIPIVILTALNSLKARQQAVEAGADTFVNKAHIFSNLVSEIQRLLSNKTKYFALDTNRER